MSNNTIEKQIEYRGLSNSPSDYDCKDGEFAAMRNCINDVNGIQAIQTPTILFALGTGMTVLAVHKNETYTHYIIVDTNNDLYAKIGESLFLMHNFGSITIKKITSIGNTLIALTSEGMFYFIWKDTAYKYIGNKIPELILSFGLQATMINSEEITSKIDYNSGGRGADQIYGTLTDDEKESLTNAVQGKVNKLIKEEITDKGKFAYSFFVRYAYIMYDKEITMHSAPILMIVSSGMNPQVFVYSAASDGTLYMKASILAAELDFVNLTESQSMTDITTNWSDIIKEVKIYISAPLYTYDESKKCEKIVKYSEVNDFTICKFNGPIRIVGNEGYSKYYQLHKFGKLYSLTTTSGTIPDACVQLPQKDMLTINDNVSSCGTFYELKSYHLTDLPTSRTKITVSKDYLGTLVNRPVMTDEFEDHDFFLPEVCHAYNDRLNIANQKKILFSGFDSSCIFQYTNGFYGTDSNSNFVDENADSTNGIAAISTVFIHENSQEKIVRNSSRIYLAKSPNGIYSLPYFYYPNQNAYRVIILTTAGYYADLPLTPHPLLNGSYYFSNFYKLTTKLIDSTYNNIVLSTDKTVSLEKRVSVSAVNNPFIYPTSGKISVGVGKILGICPAAKALSQGQFGQFPLYVFSDDGVWPLEVSSTGIYSTKQSPARDVCNNADSITQIDSAVLFSTSRGIMMIEGSETTCITDVLDGKTFDIKSLPYYTQLLQIADDTDVNRFSYDRFKDYIVGCKIAYDYKGQRFIVFNSTYSYAYVYSIRSKCWGMMDNNFMRTINSYPDCYVQTKDSGAGSTLVNLSVPDVTQTMTCFAISRPIKLDARDTLKTITDVIHRGTFSRGKLKTAMYGSRDMITWVLVSSSNDHELRSMRGSGYKYFRFVFIAKFNRDDSLSATSLLFDVRNNNKLR